MRLVLCGIAQFDSLLSLFSPPPLSHGARPRFAFQYNPCRLLPLYVPTSSALHYGARVPPEAPHISNMVGGAVSTAFSPRIASSLPLCGRPFRPASVKGVLVGARPHGVGAHTLRGGLGDGRFVLKQVLGPTATLGLLLSFTILRSPLRCISLPAAAFRVWVVHRKEGGGAEVAHREAGRVAQPAPSLCE